MFSNSTQIKYWTFCGTLELEQLYEESNRNFIRQHGGDIDDDDPLRDEFFLTPAEESTIRRHYEFFLRDFCNGFEPPMPRYVVGTAIAYLKRVFLHNSVMDYHPRDLVYTCVYLACKVEEFNLSIGQFVVNIKVDAEKAMVLILSQELLLMQLLHYHLTIHNPYRPIEGLLIHIKTHSDVPDPEKLRKGIDDFLERALISDISLIFAPSQVALAAILTSGNDLGVGLDSYVANRLLESGGRDSLMKTIEHIQRLRQMVKSVVRPNGDVVELLEVKLERCRNQENNPESDLFRQKVEEAIEEEDDRKSQKRARIAEEDAMEEEPLGQFI